LKKIKNLPIDQQKKILEEEFEKWKGNNNQTDDVIVVGINL
jgi:sigma-B regulation protein RsbU (phosphoserine phosphatase)